MSDRDWVLVTRPGPAAAKTAHHLVGLGFTPVLAPMLHIAPRRLTPITEALQAILVTSANALPALARLDRAIPLYAVGDATAARACADGFAAVHSAGRDAEALAALVAASLSPTAGRLLLASGAGQGMALASRLRGHGFIVLRRIAYAARPAETLPPAAASALATKHVGHALFFSAASARAFVACMTDRPQEVAHVQALAISEPTARALAPLPWRRIRVASHPNQDELVALLS